MSKDPYKEMARRLISKELNGIDPIYNDPYLGLAALNLAEGLVHLKLDEYQLDPQEVHGSHRWLAKIEYLIREIRSELPDDNGPAPAEPDEFSGASDPHSDLKARMGTWGLGSRLILRDLNTDEEVA